MSPQAAVIAGGNHAETDRKLFDARAYWLGSLGAREMIREGQLEDAAPVIRGLLKSAKFILHGPQSGHRHGLRMLRTARELFTLLIAERAMMADDLSATPWGEP